MKRAKIINLQKLPLPHTMTFHMLLIAMHFLLRFFFRQNIGELSNNKLKQHLKKIRPPSLLLAVSSCITWTDPNFYFSSDYAHDLMDP